MGEAFPRIKISRHKNYKHRWHCYTNFPISSSSDVISLKRQIEENDEYLGGKLGCAGAALVWRTFAIPGVRQVTISCWQLSLTKSEALLWEEIEPALIQAFKNAFHFPKLDVFGPDEKVVVPSSNPLLKLSSDPFFRR